jgi:hypothetical protein
VRRLRRWRPSMPRDRHTIARDKTAGKSRLGGANESLALALAPALPENCPTEPLGVTSERRSDKPAARVVALSEYPRMAVSLASRVGFRSRCRLAGHKITAAPQKHRTFLT